MTKYPRGSEWRKWDLHIHSDASDGASTPEEVIAEAKRKGLSVIALTDHHTVDNIDKIKEIAALPENSGISVISGIEFRSEYGAKSVHFIGLFPDFHNGTKLDGDALRDLILSPLGISKTTIITKGREENSSLNDTDAFRAGMFKVQVDLKEAAKLIHKYGGLVSIHNGSKANGLDAEVRHQGSGAHNTNELFDSLGTLKEELLNKYIDICEIRKAGDSENFYLDRFGRPSIIASDAHETNDIGNKFTWIKADPTFDGLRQIIFEPEDRVCIQEACPESKSIYNLIDTITLSETGFWSQTIPLNENLSVIIGGRSTGKSTLLESIAEKISPNSEKSLYNSEDQTNRKSFINEHINSISVNWKDKTDNTNRLVDYFQQSRMYEIAKDQHKVDELVENIIKEDSTNACLLSTLENEISINQDAIISQCTNLASLYKDYLECCSNIKLSGNISGIKQEIERLQKDADLLKKDFGMSDDEYAEFEKQQDELSKQKTRLETIQKDKSAVDNLKNKSILNPAFRYELNNLSEERRSAFEQSYDSFVADVVKNWNSYIDDESQKIQKESVACNEAIQSIEKTPMYTKGIQCIAVNKQYADYQERINTEKDKLQQVSLLIQKRDILSKQIDDIKQDILKLHLEFHDKTTFVAERVRLIVGDLAITANSQLLYTELRNFLEPKLRKQSEEQRQLISSLSDDYETDLKKKLLCFINGLLDGSVACIAGNDPKDVLSDYLSKNWYSITYDLVYQKDSFRSMSPGKQAFVILKLLLEFSKRKCPILIDQPEDSLDNRAIYTELVSYLRKKKKERQIILVSHNPNVVVGADAEQVIVANQHGTNSPNSSEIKFQYYSGALEDSHARDSSIPTILESQGIREHVCDILEGGQEAFNRREKKYGFHD